MSVKKVSLSAEYDKIRRRLVVYCPPKGVKNMIEVIYKNEEQGQTKDKQDNFKIPNNIRQIGEIKAHLRIYIEDYAYTFLKKLSQTGKEEGETAVLFGERHWKNGEEYIFIKSALRIDDMKITEEQMVFTEKIWSRVYENAREYFPGQNVMGWFLRIPEYNMQITDMVQKTHEVNFAGKDKVLFIMDPGEQEEAFYVHENSRLQRQTGFYVYYEKNEPMQSYMIAYNQNKSIEETEKTPDRAVIDFRKVFAQKTDETTEEKPESGKTSKTLQICAAVALVVLGGTAYNHYRTVQNMSELESEYVANDENTLSVNAGAQTADNTGNKSSDKEANAESLETGKTGQSAKETEKQEGQQSENIDKENEKGAENTKSGGGTVNGENTANGENASDGEDIQSGGSTSGSGNGQNTSGGGQSGENASGSTKTGGSSSAGEDVQNEGSTSTSGSAQSGGNTSTSGTTENKGNTSGSGSTASESKGSNNSSSNTGKGQNTEQTIASGMQEYTIRRGDTLTGICQRKYGSIQRMDEVCEINNIKPEDIIYAGQKIFLPD